MADVNLSVEVAARGVESAIKQINQLRREGLQTGSALKGLATSASAAMEIITRSAGSTSAAVKRTKEYGQAIGIASEATKELNQNLAAQVKEYRALARVDPLGDARSRLTRAGGAGGLAGGIAIATAEQNRLATKSVSIVQDKIAVEEQLARQTAANAALEKGRWENSLLGMTKSEQAQAVLTRATQEYNAALKASNAAFVRTRGAAGSGLGGQFLPFSMAQIDQQIAATQRLTTAERELAMAQRDVTSTNSFNSSNAFQSSYSYFIIAGLASQAAQAIRGTGVAAVQAASTMERSFVDVDRTTEGTTAQLESLRSKLLELSTSTPISFVDLSQIASLGNQLGIAASDIEGFTQTIAKYSAISGQTAEDAATAFGRISNLTKLPASQFSNLASSIEYVARTSVATESSIASAAKEISALAAGAGFSAQGIVGLAGALSSLAIPPERARGALSLYFGALNESIAEGGPKLEAFATLLGTTTENVSNLVRANRGQEVFTKFISGLSDLDSVAKTTALDTLGLSTIRVDQTMRALAQNVPLVTSVMQGANQAFAENTELGRQYAKIQEAFDSVWKELTNSIQNAAGAVGDKFLPLLKDVFRWVTQAIVVFSQFANSPIGKSFLQVAGFIGVLVGVITGLIGALALMKASFVVARFAFAGMESHSLVVWLKQVGASLFSVSGAAKTATVSTLTLKDGLFVTGVAAETTTAKTVTLRGALSSMNLGAKAAAASMGLLKIALPIAALTLLWTGIQLVMDAMERANNPAKFLGDSVENLHEAMKIDNPKAFASAVVENGAVADLSRMKLDGLNKTVADAVLAQKAASSATEKTNVSLDAQSLAVGKATKEWIANAVVGSDAMKDLINGVTDFWGTQVVDPDDLSAMLAAGFDLEKFSTIAYDQGVEAAIKYVDGWAAQLDKNNPLDQKAIDELGLEHGGASFLIDKNKLASVAKGLAQAKVQASIVSSVMKSLGVGTEEATQDFDAFGNVIGTTTANLGAAEVGFRGSKSALADFQGAVQGAMKDFVKFDDILKNASKDSKGKDIAPTLGSFGTELSKANADAEKFYNNITTLSASGASAFALGLATIGPDAQDILGQAVSASPETIAKLERDARFAAFIASDAFKQALQQNLSNQNDAYARIFSTTGNLDDVRSYIAAQVDGTAELWEQQWDLKHFTAPLNVKILDPSADELEILGHSLSGRLKITANIIPVIGANDSIDPTKAAKRTNTITDTLTGRSITVPATLQGAALTASLTEWMKDQSLSPAALAAKLNTDGFDTDLDAWRKAHGPVVLKVRFSVSNDSLPILPGYVGKNARRDGGLIGDRGEFKRFAKGGSPGQFRGPGSGTSDDILAWVSNREYINTAAATKFWGVDFFDSLNRKMLPTSFIKMLGAAAVSGNSGPQSVAHVQLIQNYPQTVNPLKDLKIDSEKLAAGIWG